MKISEKLRALQAQRQTAIDAADAILATVSDESLSPEQTADCDKHLAEVDRIGNEIEAAVKSEKEVAEKISKLESLRNAPMNADVARIVNRGSGMSSMPSGGNRERWTIPATRCSTARPKAATDLSPAGRLGHPFTPHGRQLRV